MNPGTYQNYSQAWDVMKTHPFRTAEIPVEHAVSLPLPTLAFLAAPDIFSLPAPSPPPNGGTDLFGTRPLVGSRRLFAFRPDLTRTSALHFSDVVFPRQEVNVRGTMETLQQWQQELPAVMDEVIPGFFAEHPFRQRPASVWWDYWPC